MSATVSDFFQKVAVIARNKWPTCSGLGGRHGSELMAVLLRITHIRAKIYEGFPFSVFEDIQKEINLSRKELSVILEINERTLTRRKESKRFNKVESDRIYRLIRILLFTESVFGNIEKTQTWLKRPNRSIGGEIPIKLLDTDIGTQLVENVLKRIEHGIYS